MNVICTKCGGTKVSCEAMIDPNTKEFHNYTDESFQYGWCDQCGHGTVLTDTDEVLYFFNDAATSEIYTLSLHDALPILEKL